MRQARGTTHHGGGFAKKTMAVSARDRREQQRELERGFAAGSSASRSTAQSPLYRHKLSSHSYREAVGGAITNKYRYWLQMYIATRLRLNIHLWERVWYT